MNKKSLSFASKVFNRAGPGPEQLLCLSSSQSWLQVCYVCGQTCRHECRYCMDGVICIENFIFKVLICDKTVCLYCLTLNNHPRQSPHLTSRPFHNLVHCIWGCVGYLGPCFGPCGRLGCVTPASCWWCGSVGRWHWSREKIFTLGWSCRIRLQVSQRLEKSILTGFNSRFCHGEGRRERGWGERAMGGGGGEKQGELWR